MDGPSPDGGVPSSFVSGLFQKPCHGREWEYDRPMGIRPIVLVVPSMAAAVELPRRLASTGRALAGLYPFKLHDLARAVAEPVLLGRGLLAWDAGHDALLARRLLEEDAGPDRLPLGAAMPLTPVAAALARTLSSLRTAGVPPEALAPGEGLTGGAADGQRRRALVALYRRFQESVEGRFADPATLLRAAREHVGAAAWLAGAEVLVVEDLELEPLEREFLDALARRFPTRWICRAQPAGLQGTFSHWAQGRGLSAVAPRESLLAPLEPEAVPAGLHRLRTALFEPPDGGPVGDDSVELLTAPGEAAEVRAIARRLLREASRGVPFEDMGVVLARPADYAALFTDLFDRLGVPHRLHPSLPLRFGRSARSLLLLFRCRGLGRAEVMEFLTFAPVPFAEMLGPDVPARPAQWDAISRDAGIVSGLERWIIGLRAFAEGEREAAGQDTDDDRRQRRLRRVLDAESLLRVVELLSATLDALSGQASWPEWSARLRVALDQWVGPSHDRTAVADVVIGLGGLGSVGGRAAWADVEGVLEARFEWERLPLLALSGGGVHVGALDAMAGLPFRVVAIPGLVEGGYPGVLRPDPFLLDAERYELAAALVPVPRSATSRQLSLFDPAPAPVSTARSDVPHPVPTTQDRLLETRRLFHRAVRQATERLILSYPRADARSGRERMPSLFFVAAASAREGRTLGAADLLRLVGEDDLDGLAMEDALDRSERDRVRVRRDAPEAVYAVAAGSVFFKQSHLASAARWSNRLTAYDGLVNPLPAALAARLDLTSAGPVSASRLATFSRCGFLYLLQNILRLDPTLEPEERKRLEPLERGDLFHRVAERFLRERRDRGELPVRNTSALRERLLQMADEALDGLVAGRPPRFVVLWERERLRFRETMLAWLVREADSTRRALPAHFEVSFGPSRERALGEPHREEPVAIDLLDGRVLKISGKIDRIDRRPEGGLVLRDYKTGKAPRDDGGIFRGGKQLQIPFYVLAAATLFPDEPVVEAFLDYVDAGRPVTFDPARVTSPAFTSLLRGLVDTIAEGAFVQEPSACDWCDYTAVCGPRPLLERRRQYKLGDPRLQKVLRLRDVP
jgi:ATP-dependent helicase/nuclease subunit B